mmetsp:Transcript_7835/g.25569  ORF Transcript_7835/g.25569 Transcript_7835/m.25569 type:complete len:306 (-) Transcript_7835:370-1287(-)
MLRRAAAPGKFTRTLTSRRPGRNSAGSSNSGMFVVARTMRFPASSTPSMLARSCAVTESRTPVESARLPRLRQMASISSKITTLIFGITFARLKPEASSETAPAVLMTYLAHSAFGLSKSALTRSSATPTNLSSSSGPLTTETRSSSQPSAAATCLAKSVFPQPGGPYSSAPRTCDTPSSATSWLESLREASSRRDNSSTTSSRPPTCVDSNNGACATGACATGAGAGAFKSASASTKSFATRSGGSVPSTINAAPALPSTVIVSSRGGRRTTSTTTAPLLPAAAASRGGPPSIVQAWPFFAPAP